MEARALTRMTEDEYLASEATALEKHEYVNGEAHAMAGGTPAHAIMAASIARIVGNALRGKPCVVASSDLRVHVESTGMYTYPDVTVVCGKLETARRDPNSVTNPKVIFEILSDSTEAHDRGARLRENQFRHYERIPSLEAYVLVAQDGRRIEQFARRPDGWLRTTADLDGGPDAITIAALDVRVAVAELIEGLPETA
jgi:Uma2 family endonuclease